MILLHVPLSFLEGHLSFAGAMLWMLVWQRERCLEGGLWRQLVRQFQAYSSPLQFVLPVRVGVLI